ncbi:MAG: hypothetical protein ACYTEP_03930 [Planctomycetota bacterium]|jgi:hypothetical protein
MGFRLPIIALPVLAVCLSCSGGTGTARLPELNVPAALADGTTLQGAAAETAFAEWRNALSTDPILPMSVRYSLNSKVELTRDGQQLEGGADGEFRFQGMDRDRTRLDAFLILDGLEWEQDWNLTGTLQFDGFFVRAWGTASGIEGIDPDRTYAVQFAQQVFEDTYASLQRLMPKFLQGLRESGIAGGALLMKAEQEQLSAVQMFHPARFLTLIDSAFVCRSIRHEEDRIHCTFSLDLSEDSPLRPAFESLLGAAPEELRTWAETTTIEEVFEAHTGLLVGVNFLAEHTFDIDEEEAAARLQFQLTATELEWRVEDLDRAISRPDDVDPLDLTAMLKLADKFLREKEAEMDAEEDFEFH